VKKNKFLFTRTLIEKLEPGNKRTRYYDTKVYGLMLEVMPTGSKIYRLRRTVHYKNEVATIGNSRDITLDQAREKAIKLSAQLINGGSFVGARQAIREEMTLEELGSLYFDQYAKDRCVTYEEMKKCFKRWYHMHFQTKVSKITVHMLQLHINKLAAEKHYYRANRALDQIKAIFNWGIKKGMVQTNPALSVDQFRERSRDRFIQPHEFPALLNAIKAYPDDRLQDFFLLCLYTGARSGNVLAMRWDELDKDLGTWRIPLTKNGDSQTISLSDAALEILEKRRQKRNLLPWVFPGGHKEDQSNYDHLKEPKKAWSLILKAAGINNLHIHDLRRSLASYMVMTGASTPLVQKQLGHKSLLAASVYQRVHDTPAKLAADQAIKVMQQFADKPAETKIISM